MELPVEILVIALYQNDSSVARFVHVLSASLANYVHITVITCPSVSEAIIKLAGISHSPNVILFVTHGNENGQPTFEDDAPISPETARVLYDWKTNKMALFGKCNNALLILAACGAGREGIIIDMQTGGFSFESIITPAPFKELQVDCGARSIACYLNKLASPEITQPDRVLQEVLFEEMEFVPGWKGIWFLWPWLSMMGPVN